MTVTKIEQQKKDKSRYSVYIDGEFAFGLIMEDILFFKVKEGEELSQEKYDYIMDTTVYIRAQDMVARFLGYKMRTKKEVADKLSDSGYSEDICQRVLQSLEKYDYINDYIYCTKYIKETLKLRPKGKFLIKQELKLKGIDDETVNKAIDEMEIDEFQIAKSILMKKYEDFAKMDNKELAKVYGFLQRKGFSYSVIKEAVSDLADKGI